MHSICSNLLFNVFRQYNQKDEEILKINFIKVSLTINLLHPIRFNVSVEHTIILH